MARLPDFLPQLRAKRCQQSLPRQRYTAADHQDLRLENADQIDDTDGQMPHIFIQNATRRCIAHGGGIKGCPPREATLARGADPQQRFGMPLGRPLCIAG